MEHLACTVERSTWRCGTIPAGASHRLQFAVVASHPLQPRSAVEHPFYILGVVRCYARQQVQLAITATVEHAFAALVLSSLNNDRNRWWSGHVMSGAGRDVTGDAQEPGRSGGEEGGVVGANV